jgi:hypothetical protein
MLLVWLSDRIVAHLFEKAYLSNKCSHSSGELNTYLQSNTKFDYLILGSSRVNTMIDPTIIDSSAHNLSQPAKHFYYHCAVANLLDQKGRMPRKKLIVNIELEDVYVELEEYMVNDVFYLKYYYPESSYIREMIHRKGFAEKIKFLCASYRFNGENLRLFTNPLQGVCKKPTKGFFPLKADKLDSVKLEKDMRELNDITYTSFNKKYFTEITQLKNLCAKNRIELVLLIGPHPFRNVYFQKASSKMLKFCKMNEISLIHFDSEKENPFSKRSCWKDYLHLNEQAAIIYSEMLRDRLKGGSY